MKLAEVGAQRDNLPEASTHPSCREYITFCNSPIRSPRSPQTLAHHPPRGSLPSRMQPWCRGPLHNLVEPIYHPQPDHDAVKTYGQLIRATAKRTINFEDPTLTPLPTATRKFRKSERTSIVSTAAEILHPYPIPYHA